MVVARRQRRISCIMTNSLKFSWRISQVSNAVFGGIVPMTCERQYSRPPSRPIDAIDYLSSGPPRAVLPARKSAGGRFSGVAGDVSGSVGRTGKALIYKGFWRWALSEAPLSSAGSNFPNVVQAEAERLPRAASSVRGM
jgi:hypothetical protein